VEKDHDAAAAPGEGADASVRSTHEERPERNRTGGRSASMAAARRITKPCRGCGSRYGIAATQDEAERVIEAGQRPDLLVAASRLAQLAAGGELAWEYVERVVVTLGDLLGRDAGEVRRMWAAACRYGEAAPRRAPTEGRMATSGDVVLRLLDWWERAEADQVLTRHRSGATARRVLAAFLLAGLAANRIELAESQRELAEAAGVARRTVRRTRPLWRRHVHIVEPGSRHTGSRTRYRLTATNPSERAHYVPKPEAKAVGYGRTGDINAAPLSGSEGPTAAPESGGLNDPAANYWNRCSACWLVWRALHDEPQRPREIAEAVGRRPNSVRRILNRFADDELAVRTPDGWIRAADPIEPAGFDWATDRRERHEAERRRYRSRLANRRQEAS
jgi:hypothetical protein